jgi:hypothetical protein
LAQDGEQTNPLNPSIQTSTGIDGIKGLAQDGEQANPLNPSIQTSTGIDGIKGLAQDGKQANPLNPSILVLTSRLPTLQLLSQALWHIHGIIKLYLA